MTVSFWGELKRRNVFRVGVAYLALAWLLVQVASIVLPAFDVARWAMQGTIVVLAIGFPIALICAWIYEFTPEGLRRTDDLPPEAVVVVHSGRKLDFAIIGVLALALITVVAGRYLIEPEPVARLDSIAVLPLVNLSGDSDQEYFADGMTEALISNLAKISALRVISRTSAMRYKNSTMSLPEIAAELGVAVIVEGSAVRSGDRIRITAQLIDAATDRHLWTETYDRDFSDSLALQSALARRIAEQIAITVTPQEQQRLAAATGVDSVAYEAYLKGLQHFYRLTPADLDLAQQYFESALEADPDSARAHAGVALTWVGRMQMGFIPASVAGPQAKAFALRALTLDEDIAEVHFVLANVNTWFEWDFAAAETQFLRAIELRPGYPDAAALYSHYLSAMGRTDEALEQIDRALDLDPFNPFFRALNGVVLHMAGRYDEATDEFQAALAVVPNLPFALQVMTGSLHFAGRYDEALAAQKTLMTVLGDAQAAAALDSADGEGGYVKAMRRVAEISGERSLAVGAAGFFVASRYSYAGDSENVIAWVRHAIEQRDPNVPYLRLPEFGAVRGDPRFAALVEEVGL